MELKKQVDVCVVGAGHAGCEAALACARLGLKTVIFTVSVDSIALMPCNPNVGGSSKGHLVRELDALGGEMVYSYPYSQEISSMHSAVLVQIFLLVLCLFLLGRSDHQNPSVSVFVLFSLLVP